MKTSMVGKRSIDSSSLTAQLRIKEKEKAALGMDLVRVHGKISATSAKLGFLQTTL